MARPLFAAALCGALFIVRIAGAQAEGGAPSLSFPVDCDLGTTCVVQNYFDHDPGAGTRDYHCGSLTYNGHDGTDIRLVNLAAMNKGFRVLAAADGKVRAIRDGMPDVSFRDIGKDAIKGREAGNGVAIDHGNGWETQYSHLRRGSVRVKPGDPIKRGQPLGLIGLSGWTEFPHLHLTVRINGRKIDPFVGTAQHIRCGLGASPVWEANTLAALQYAPGGILAAGFAGEVVSFAQVKAGKTSAVHATAPVLLFWVNAYGLRAGDSEHFRILSPDGSVFSESRRTVDGNKAESFSYAGKKRGNVPWPGGTYRGEYSLRRDAAEGAKNIISIVREARISP